MEKFTIKSQELIKDARELAERRSNQQIEPEHLLAAMLDDREGMARSMLRKLGVSPDAVAGDIADAVNRLPKVSTNSMMDIYISSGLKCILDAAFMEAA
ncbi:MAG: type VI secretion system ATPase TssH, partial [Deltaproteobacteria bacterium]|nr:type VI secretion system ATPase TssH [Deltaproteobacteria bacterium]